MADALQFYSMLVTFAIFVSWSLMAHLIHLSRNYLQNWRPQPILVFLTQYESTSLPYCQHDDSAVSYSLELCLPDHQMTTQDIEKQST